MKNEKYYGILTNLLHSTVQDKETYSWDVVRISENQQKVVLLSKNENLSDTKMIIVSSDYFFNNFYQYRGRGSVLTPLVDIYK